MTRRLVLPASLFFALLLATPSAASEGGALAPFRIRAQSFSASPTVAAPGAQLTFAARIAGRRGRVRLRIDLVPAGAHKALLRVPLGVQRTRRNVTQSLTPAAGALPEGRYVARLMIYGRGRLAGGHGRAFSNFSVWSTPPASSFTSVTSGVFPVQGAYSFGGPDARFGAPRGNHIHQGQDILAASGTPIVSPVAGTVYWRAYQAGGAGYYLVVRGADGPDYVFMHLLKGSWLVKAGDPVTAGQRIGQVGATGDASGPHLHFEIWPDGWYSSPSSKPIDPLPQLEAWAAQAG